MKMILTFWVLCWGLLTAGEPLKVGNFTFKPGDGWVLGERSPMVKAALHHGEKGGPLLKFYHFGQGQGGGVEANLKRWEGQFQNGEAKVTSKKLVFGDQKATVVAMTGTYLVGPMMARDKKPTPDYLLLGAILPHPSGDVFLKMTGPEADLDKVKGDFEKLVASAFPKEE